MIIFASLQNFMSFYTSLTPFKSMPEASNHDSKEMRESMHIKDILTKLVFLLYASAQWFASDRNTM